MRRQGIPIPETAGANERHRILVVDDDPIIVETIVQALEEDEFDYEVISASGWFRGRATGQPLPSAPDDPGHHDARHQRQ